MDGATAVANMLDAPIPDVADVDAAERFVEFDPLESQAANDATTDAETTSDVNAATESSDEAATITPIQIVEAILFASDAPLPAAKIAQAVGGATPREVREHVTALNLRYEQTGSAVRACEIAGGYQLRTLPVFHAWLARLHKARQETKLSAAAMETLSIVAYKQPVMRADIEAVRGVSTGDILNRLREMDLVRIVGRAEDLGRPMLYGTTKRFLEVFGLPGLGDLPKMESPAAATNPAPQTKGAGIARPEDMPTPPPPPEPRDGAMDDGHR